MRSTVTASRRRFSQEFKDELCLEVISTSKTIKDVAVAYGVGTETLWKWLVKYRDANGGTEAELTLTERARLKELERVVQNLRAETGRNHPRVLFAVLLVPAAVVTVPATCQRAGDRRIGAAVLHR